MRSTRDIERLGRMLVGGARPAASARVLADAKAALAQAVSKREDGKDMTLLEKIMRNGIVQVGVAAVVVVALAIVVHLWGGRVDGTSVAWGQVARKVAEADGYSCMARTKTIIKGKTSQREAFVYVSKAFGVRVDDAAGGVVTSVEYLPANSNELTKVSHELRQYERIDLPRQQNRFFDAGSIVQWFASEVHTELGREVIDGREVEGIRVNKSGTGGLPDSEARLWVDIKTGLPVRIETKTRYLVGFIEESVIDGFQWGNKLDKSEFEPVIPAGYTLIPETPAAKYRGNKTGPAKVADVNSLSGSKTVPADANNTSEAPKGKKSRGIADADVQVITVKVVEEGTGKALAGAKVVGESEKGRATALTDEAGVAKVRIPKKTSNASLKATYARHVGLSKGFQGKAAQNLPTDYTFTLELGKTGGGVVKNPEGESIEGVTINVVGGVVSYGRGPVRYHTPPGYPDVYDDANYTTGKDGRWRCNLLPADVNTICLDFVHPEYQQVMWDGMSGDANDLKTESHVQLMKHGLRVYGIVSDTEGKPIAGATVLLDLYGQHMEPMGRTGSDGRFDIGNAVVDRSIQVVTVIASGYAPSLKEVSTSEAAAEQQFVLEKAHILKGKVIDANGAPVQRPWVRVHKWRGHETIGRDIEADANGRFEWKWAPADDFELAISGKGLRETIVPRVIADGREKAFVVNELLRVTGRVTDAETGKAVEKFAVVQGYASVDEEYAEVYFGNGSTKVQEFKDGRYRTDFKIAGKKYGIKIMAKGYLPVESRAIESDEQDVVCDFRLERVAGARGIVRLPDGKPAAGVSVYMLGRHDSLWLKPDGSANVRAEVPSAKTDANGFFAMEEATAEYWVAAVADAGVAWATKEELRGANGMTLAPWGRIEGEYYVGNKLAAKRQFEVECMQTPGQAGGIKGHYEVSTDEQGRFVVGRIRPGRTIVDGRIVDVAAGGTTHVKMGGNGRTVTAEIVWQARAEDKGEIHPNTIAVNTLAELDQQDFMYCMPWPANAETMTSDELRAWSRDFVRSDEGRKLLEERESNWHDTLAIANEGRLNGWKVTFDNVEAGKYAVHGSVGVDKFVGSSMETHSIGAVYLEFEMPEIKAGALDTPLDLGKIVAARPLREGDKAFEFELDGIGEQKVRLADHAGKVVLVTVYGSDDLKNDPNITNLREIHEAHAGGGGLAMIGIVLYEDVYVRAVVREMALPWPQGFAGRRESVIRTAYGKDYSALNNVLIGPDGKVIAVGLKGEELAKKVEEAMEKK